MEKNLRTGATREASARDQARVFALGQARRGHARRRGRRGLSRRRASTWCSAIRAVRPSASTTLFLQLREDHHILARNEQGAVHMADGYARATGRPAWCSSQAGRAPRTRSRASRRPTWTRSPRRHHGEQVPRAVIGTDSFQESDIFGITMPVVKHSFLLQSVSDLTRVFREAFHIAVTGRPGPVLIDVPSDIARETVVFEYPDGVTSPPTSRRTAATPSRSGPRASSSGRRVGRLSSQAGAWSAQARRRS